MDEERSYGGGGWFSSFRFPFDSSVSSVSVMFILIIENARTFMTWNGQKSGSTLEPKCKTYYSENQIYNNGNFMN